MAAFLRMSWLEPLLVMILAVLVAVVLANVIGRYFFGFALTWADEMARFLFVWLTFLGATVGLARGAHIGMDIVVQALPPRGARALQTLALLLIMIFLSVWGWYSIELVQRSMALRTPAMGLPLGYIYAIAPISAGLMLLVCLYQFVRTLRGQKAQDA
ncbi:MAG: TRAP transporter small permease [Truepera sp.]|nr:TRAP transporter small permease [Truepera sp.]